VTAGYDGIMVNLPASEQLERIWSPYRHELTRDHVGLWALIGAVKDAEPEGTAEDVRSMTMEVLRYALERSDAVAGHFDGKTYAFVPWEGSADDVIARAEREWDVLGREPNIGEVLALMPPLGRAGG
jgi:hypothetical protein